MFVEKGIELCKRFFYCDLNLFKWFFIVCILCINVDVFFEIVIISKFVFIYDNGRCIEFVDLVKFMVNYNNVCLFIFFF